MIENKLSYRNIFKATSLFGGVQLYQIIIQVVRSKFLALFLGTTGMGINGLYLSVLDLIKKTTSLGLSQSAVRDISEAYSTRELYSISRTVSILRHLVWVTGLFGLVAVLCLAPYLSRTVFGNEDYTIPFMVLSVTLLFDQISSGQRVVLQGMRRLKDLARASAIGCTIGLLASIPLYYFLRLEGIVPTLVLNSLAMLAISFYYSRKVKVNKVRISGREVVAGGSSMLKMGIAMTVSGALTALSSFIIRWFIRLDGGVDSVGLFQAGFVIVNNYIGLVFSALGTDYYPRLAGVNKNNEACKQVVNQQGEIAVLLLGPIICVCLVLMPVLVILLYSRSFVEVNDFILWALIGLSLKLLSWLVAFQFIAKGESKLFIVNESAVNVYQLLFFYLGFHFGGMKGLGIAYTLTYLMYSVQVYAIAHRKYGFSFSSSFLSEFIVQFVFILLCFLGVLLFPLWLKYVFGSIIFCLSAYVSARGLNNRIGLSVYIKDKIHGRR